MNEIIKVRYKWDTDESEDLICELTEFFDKYFTSDIKKANVALWKTYLYNDLNKNEDGTYRISFRVPGATRGGLILKRINYNEFQILKIHFIEDTCFGQFQCYDKKLKKDSNQFINKILDFSDVKLINNKIYFEQ